MNVIQFERVLSGGQAVDSPSLQTNGEADPGQQRQTHTGQTLLDYSFFLS